MTLLFPEQHNAADQLNWEWLGRYTVNPALQTQLPLGGAYTNGVTAAKVSRDLVGIVHLSGQIVKASVWFYNEVIATLPVGFRPASIEVFLLAGQDSVAGPVAFRVDVAPSGTMTLVDTVPHIVTPGNLTYVSPAAITFLQAG